MIHTWHGGSRNTGKEKRARDAELGFARAGKAKEFTNGDHLFLLFVFFGRRGCRRRGVVVLLVVITVVVVVVVAAGSIRSLFGRRLGRILVVMLGLLHAAAAAAGEAVCLAAC